MGLLAIPAAERSLPEALGLGAALLARAEREQVALICASVIHGPAVILGAAQRVGRVLELAACDAAGIPVMRRVTTGTAAWVGRRGILWTLALPHVASLVRDASARTLLNRNVRGFLRGLGSIGAPARYFGREWIAAGSDHRPVAVLGFEGTEGGAVLIEVIAGFDDPMGLPGELATDVERATDRWRGKAPISLREARVEARDRSLTDLARAVIAPPAWPIDGETTESAVAAQPVCGLDDPIPAGFDVGPVVPTPVGWIDAAREPSTGRVWLGGDVLVPSFALRAFAEARGAMPALAPGAIPIDGARLEDLRTAAASTWGSG